MTDLLADPADESAAPLSWSQHWAWVDNHGSPPVPIPLTVEVPAGVGIQGVERVLSGCFRRHEALRTTFHIGHDGTPYQTVHPPTDAPLRIVDSPDLLTPFVDLIFDLERCFPVHAELLAPHGTPAALYLAVHHIAADGVAISTLAEELTHHLELVAEGKTPEVVPSSWSPRRQAALEASEASQSRSEAALGHWRDLHAVQPLDLTPPKPGGQRAPAYQATLISRRVAELCQTIARKNRCLPAAVMMAATAVSLANMKGRDRCLLSPITRNRMRPGTQASVCMLMGRGLALLDLRDDPPFTAILANAMTELKNLMVHGSFNEGEYYMEMAAAGVRRDGSFIFNFVMDADDGHPREGGRIEYEGRATNPPESAIEVVNSRKALMITVIPESSCMLPDEAQAFLEGLPVLLEQVRDNPRTARSQLRGILPRWTPPSADWVDIRGAWTDLREVRCLLETCPDVAQAAAFTTGNSDSQRDHSWLTVCAVVAPGTTPGKLREFLTDRVALLPDWFVLREDAPENPAALQSWREPRLLTEGDGRRAEFSAPRNASESVLARSFERYHENNSANMELSYAENGGEFVKIPAMIRAVRSQGARELSVDHFMSTMPLRTLAGLRI